MIAPAVADFGSFSPNQFLHCLSEATRQRLLESARRHKMPAGVLTEWPKPVFMGDLVEHGLMRVFQIASDGRESTVRYAHASDLLGALAIDDVQPSVYLQAVEPTTLLRLNAELMRDLYASDIQVAQAVAAHTASILLRVVRVVTVRTLGTVQQKLAFDLLERACAEQLRHGRLEVTATQEALANGIGSSRETVTRILASLRRQNVLTTASSCITVREPRRLVDIVHGLVT